MLQIILDNNKSRIIGDAIQINRLREATKIRKPGAFYSPAYANRSWDGFVRYITEANGLVSTGLVPKMVDACKELSIECEVVDKRNIFKHTKIYDTMKNGDVLRGYQLDAVKSFLENRFMGIRFQRGVTDAATNAGKSYIAAGVFGSYSDKRTGMLLIDNTEIFQQLYEDLKVYLGEDTVGLVSSKKVELKRINVCMVQTLSLRLQRDRKLRAMVEKTDVIIVDECDTTAVKTQGRKILGYACNATVRLGLSGTPFSHKDKTKNQEVLAYFGPTVYKITNQELVNLGVSTKPIIRMRDGNKKDIPNNLPYADAYELGITKNKQRNGDIWKLVGKHIKKKRLPILIIVRYQEHVTQLLKRCPDEIKEAYKINWATSKKDSHARKKVLLDFKEGRLDILVASMIIQRGKNLPLTQVLINASGGTSERVLLQIFGRLLRAHSSKKKVYMEDFFDKGKHLSKHSRKRLIYYKNQGFGVKELYSK